MYLLPRMGNVIHAAILDFTITKYGDDQIHGFIRFLDPWSLHEDIKIIFLAHFLEELRMILANVDSLSHVRLSVVCLSSVTLVRPTKAVQIFGNISTAFGTLAIRW